MRSDMTDKEYLDKALEFIVEREESNDYICEMLHRILEESELCAKNCQNLDRFCVLRFLENYTKDE